MNSELRCMFNYIDEMGIKQCRQSIARDKRGRAVDHTDPRAASWCIVGIWNVCQLKGMTSFHGSFTELGTASIREFGADLVEANNKLGITFKQFRAAVEKHFPDEGKDVLQLTDSGSDRTVPDVPVGVV